jgi:hypothetical protein
LKPAPTVGKNGLPQMSLRVFADTAPAAKPSQTARHCERSEAIQNPVRRPSWIASSLRFSQ